MNWPNFFPEGCPPIDNCDDFDNIVYRAIPMKKSREIKEKDFYSQRENQPNRTWPPDTSECELCSISVLVNYEDAKILIEHLSSLPSKKNKIIKIAKARLNGNDGVFRSSPDLSLKLNSHNDWWKPNGVESWRKFQYAN